MALGIVLMISPRTPKIAQRQFEAWSQAPLDRPDRLGKSQAFELARPVDIWFLPTGARAKVKEASALVGDIPKRPVQARPALGLDLLLETGPISFSLLARSELERNALSGSLSKPCSHSHGRCRVHRRL
jgi:hypothetical protein